MTLHPPYVATQFTHHVWPLHLDRRIALALCGRILPRWQSVPDPTCPICRVKLAQLDLARLQDVRTIQ